MKRIILPAVTALIVVWAFIAVAGWNRSGEPGQVITLTERELVLPRALPSDDDPGIQLRFNYSSRSEPLDARTWLTDDRLRALGFAMQIPVGSPDAATHYRRALKRVGWVVLEYGGSAWQESERRRAVSPEVRPADLPTRLIAVDGGPEFEPLRARYQSGYLILRAVFALSYADRNGPLVFGYVQQLVPDVVTVPLRLRDRLPTLGPRDDDHSPRYEVDLAVGRFGVPFVRDIRSLR